MSYQKVINEGVMRHGSNTARCFVCAGTGGYGYPIFYRFFSYVSCNTAFQMRLLS